MSQFFVEPITQLPPGVSLSANDVTPVVDVLDLSESPSGTTKKYTMAQLAGYLQTQFGGSNLFSVQVATTAALTTTYDNGMAGVGATLTNGGALAGLVIDGVTMVVGNRILVKNQASSAQNGIYTVTNIGSGSVAWIITRASDYDDSIPGQIEQGNFVVVVEGTVNALTMWVETGAGPFVIGTTPIVFSEQVVSAGVTNGANLGAGDGIFSAVVATVMQFKSLIAGTNITLTPTGTDITIDATAPGGTITGGTSLGGTDAVFAGVSGPDLTFKGLTAGANITLTPSGTAITISSAGAGVAGDFIFSNVNYAGSISLTNNTAADVTSISLPAGDWDVYGNVFFNCTGGTATNCYGWTSETSATYPDASMTCEAQGVLDDSNQGLECPYLRVNVGSTTTVYLTGQAAFSSGAATVCGSIFARRSVTFNGNIGVATGSSLTFTPGQGVVGITNGSGMGAGYVGEIIGSNVPSASSFNISNNTPTNVTTLSLSAGNWLITGNIAYNNTAAVNPSYAAAINFTSATFPDGSLIAITTPSIGTFTNQTGLVAPSQAIYTASPVTAYLVGQTTVSGGTVAIFGNIIATRIS